MHLPAARPALPFLLVAASIVCALPALAAAPQPGPPLTIRRAAGPITIDGDPSDPGWQGIEPVTQWFETNIGDNVEPQVRNVAYLAYDDRFFYAAFVFDDPDPRGIRAPVADHDQLPGSTDYAGLIIDSRNDGKTAQMFLANLNGLKYDAISSDVSGEDNSPDYYWDSMGRRTATGWTLEIRVPFSTLRYADPAAPTFGLLLYRNYPRDRRYQFFSARLPRDVNCFICNSSKLTGLANLPRGSHLVVAPFATASRTSVPSTGLGGPLDSLENKADGGLDLKWSPGASTAIDATLNPDFSQVEADAAQIVANERFALFFPEKRPFFLEGVDLFATPLTAVYTRTVTAPNAGARITGRAGDLSYTALVTQDEGDGVVILPGPQGSGDAPQDFVSDVAVLRLRRDLGSSFVSLLATGRAIHGGGSNAVFGPDFQWRPTPTETFSGQFVWSETQTPNRTDLTAEWNGRKLSDGAGLLRWSHGTRTNDVFLQFQALGPDFRADNGFIPQVGYREGYFEAGLTVRPQKAFLSRIRFFTVNWYDWEPNGDLLSRRTSVGAGMDGRWNSFFRVELNRDAVRVGGVVLEKFRPFAVLTAVPGRIFNNLSIDASAGEEIDFANAREANGVSLNGSLTVRPLERLEFRGNVSRRWIDVDDPVLGAGRLFTAQVERLRVSYSFSARSFLRIIGQYVETTRDPSLYTFPTGPKSASFSGSALFAYKLNWQTVLYAGYGDDQVYSGATGELEPAARQFFAKLSYAWQR